MTSRNDITGDFIKTGSNSDAYKDGWERIFGKKKPTESQVEETQETQPNQDEQKQ